MPTTLPLRRKALLLVHSLDEAHESTKFRIMLLTRKDDTTKSPRSHNANVIYPRNDLIVSSL